MRVTSTAWGLFVAPGSLTETWPVYVPAPRPDGFTETEMRPPLPPEAGATEIQVRFAAAVQLRVPSPVFETPTVWAGVVPEPWAEPKTSLVRLSPILGPATGAKETVKEIVAPAGPMFEMLSPPAEPPARKLDGLVESLIEVRPAPLEKKAASGEPLAVGVPLGR